MHSEKTQDWNLMFELERDRDKNAKHYFIAVS